MTLNYMMKPPSGRYGKSKVGPNCAKLVRARDLAREGQDQRRRRAASGRPSSIYQVNGLIQMNNPDGRREPSASLLDRISQRFWGFAERGDLFGRSLFLWTLVFSVNLLIYLVLSKIIIPSKVAHDYLSVDNLYFFSAVAQFYLLSNVLVYLALFVTKRFQHDMSDNFMRLGILLACVNFTHLCHFFGGIFILIAPIFLLITITNVSIFFNPRMGAFALICSFVLYLGSIILEKWNYLTSMSVILEPITVNEIFTNPTLMITFTIIFASALLIFEYFVIHIIALIDQKTEQTLTLNAELQASIERLKELDVMKDNFLSMVSHDLRSPMTSVRGYAEIMLERLGELDQTKQRLCLETIISEGDRLTRLINNLLDFQRFTAGKMDLEFKDLDLARVARKSVDFFRGAAEAKPLSLETELPAEKIWVHGDQDRLSQVMSNLLSNAIKFTPAGGHVMVRVEATAAQEKTGVRVSVSDTGPGIPQELQSIIFSQFQQASKPLRQKQEGSGLGLALAREIIEHHGGRIGLESEPGRGCHFYFLLPIINRRGTDEENFNR